MVQCIHSLAGSPAGSPEGSPAGSPAGSTAEVSSVPVSFSAGTQATASAVKETKENFVLTYYPP